MVGVFTLADDSAAAVVVVSLFVKVLFSCEFVGSLSVVGCC